MMTAAPLTHKLGKVAAVAVTAALLEMLPPFTVQVVGQALVYLGRGTKMLGGAIESLGYQTLNRSGYSRWRNAYNLYDVAERVHEAPSYHSARGRYQASRPERGRDIARAYLNGVEGGWYK